MVGGRRLALTGLPDERDDLLEIEGVAVGGVDDPLPQRELDAAEGVEELVGLRLVERLQDDGGGVGMPGAPASTSLEQIRASHAEHEDQGVAAEEGDVLDELEQRLLPPVEVVEDADHRPLPRLLLEQLAEGPRDLLRGRRRVRLPEERTERRARGVLRGQRAELFHDLDDRPVGDPVPVGQAAAAQDAGVHPGEELRDEPRLPIRPARGPWTGGTCLRHDPRKAGAERAQLALTADHRCRAVAARPRGPRSTGCVDRRGLLQLERRHGPEVDHRARRAVAVPTSTPPGARPLEPRRDVDRVTRREPFLRSCPPPRRVSTPMVPEVRAPGATTRISAAVAVRGRRRPRVRPGRRTRP